MPVAPFARAQDAALDALHERIDAEIMGQGSLLALLGHGFVVPCCSDMELLRVGAALGGCVSVMGGVEEDGRGCVRTSTTRQQV